MNKTTNKYTPEVRERAVRMVLNGEGQHERRWVAIVSLLEKKSARSTPNARLIMTLGQCISELLLK